MPRRPEWVFGDVLAARHDPNLKFIFRGWGHEGEVIARRIVLVEGRPHDVIARQRDFVSVDRVKQKAAKG